MNKINVMIADDHAVVRFGLAALIESKSAFALVGQAEDGESAVRIAARKKPDVVVMDLMMPVKDGIEATREIKEILPEVRILILTTSTVSDDIARALENGADGAITKSTANAELLAAIRAVAEGKRYLSSEIQDLLVRDPPAPKLTDRQVDILRLAVKGFTTADIARLLGIREGSVKEHMTVICSKLGASNRTEAAAIALKKNLIRD